MEGCNTINWYSHISYKAWHRVGNHVTVYSYSVTYDNTDVYIYIYIYIIWFFSDCKADLRSVLGVSIQGM